MDGASGGQGEVEKRKAGLWSRKLKESCTLEGASIEGN
jgi:hypothetical protein